MRKQPDTTRGCASWSRAARVEAGAAQLAERKRNNVQQ